VDCDFAGLSLENGLALCVAGIWLFWTGLGWAATGLGWPWGRAVPTLCCPLLAVGCSRPGWPDPGLALGCAGLALDWNGA
jgi:hypothetical protein